MTRRVCVVYTGGTFGMTHTPDGYQPRPGLAERLTGLLPPAGETGMPVWDLYEYAQLIDSADAGPRDWHAIARDIAARYDDYDGFVVIHGTDTMAYTASALSFALTGTKKPVIVTGAQIPLGEPGGDARDNLLASLLIAANHPLPEVCLYFGGRLLRGNRATKTSSIALDAFASPNWPALGHASAGGDIVIDHRAVTPAPAQEAFALADPAGAGEVALLRLYPGLSAARLAPTLAPPLAGLVLQSYGAGNGPAGLPGFIAALADASARGTVIVNVSQCATGGVAPGRYATGAALAAAGVVGASDMTVEAALTKLHHLLARGLDADAIRRRFDVPLCGECASRTPQQPG